MGCDQTEKISLLIDGELATEDARLLELHLSTCNQCNQVRADFLGLRSQISAYALSGEPSLPRHALAKVLSKSHREPVQMGWRLRFLGVGSLRFNNQLAAIAAVVLMTLAIGTIAFLRYRPHPNVVNTIHRRPAPVLANPLTRRMSLPRIPGASRRDLNRTKQVLPVGNRVHGLSRHANAAPPNHYRSYRTLLLLLTHS